MKNIHVMKKVLITLISGFIFLDADAQNFTVIDSLPIGAYGTAAWGDFDGDGRKDLAYITQTATAGQPDIFNIYHNTPSGFVLAQSLPHLFLPAAKWADLDNDGKEDLVVLGMENATLENVVHIYKSNGNGTFTLVNDTLEGLAVGSVDIADYNNDGLKDIAACGYTNHSSIVSLIFRNKGNFEFEDIHTSLFPSSGGEMKWCDYDKDGKQDLAITGLYGNSGRTHIYHNEDNDSFLLVSNYMKGGSGTLDWIDYDGDGFMDILTAGVDSSSANNYTDLYQNNGNGTFSLQANFNAPKFGEPTAVDVADFNGDGKTDICFGGSNDTFFNFSALAFGTGSATFNFQEFKRLDIQNCIVAAADIDNDGDMDILLSNFILRNDGVLNVKNTTNEKMISLYPNPASSGVFIEAKAKISIQVINMAGAVLYNAPYSEGTHYLSVSSYTDGNYFILAKEEDGYSVETFTVKH